MNLYPTQETRGALVDAAKSLGATSIHIVPVRVCDHCGDDSREAFPQNAEDYNGVLYQHLCNECYDALVVAQNNDESWVCENCGALIEWEDCYNCENGYIDLYDKDPLWYDEDDTERCSVCAGEGGWWYCPNAKSHIEEP
jgi:hypothetical protein